MNNLLESLNVVTLFVVKKKKIIITKSDWYSSDNNALVWE